MEKCCESAAGATFRGRIYSCVTLFLHGISSSHARMRRSLNTLKYAWTLNLHVDDAIQHPRRHRVCVSFLLQKGRCATGSQLDLAVSVFHMGITLN